MSSNTIEKQIFIDTPKAYVFEAITKPSLVVKYYPVDNVECDFIEGGKILYRGKETGIDIGIIDIIKENSCFQITYWNVKHETKNQKENWVTLRYSLVSEDKGTRLTVTQSNIPSGNYRNLMEPAWDYLLNDLKVFVERKNETV